MDQATIVPWYMYKIKSTFIVSNCCHVIYLEEIKVIDLSLRSTVGILRTGTCKVWVSIHSSWETSNLRKKSKKLLIKISKSPPSPNIILLQVWWWLAGIHSNHLRHFLQSLVQHDTTYKCGHLSFLFNSIHLSHSLQSFHVSLGLCFPFSETV